MDYKDTIIHALEVLLKDNKAKGENFKVKAYSNAIRQIKMHTGPIRGEADLTGIGGIGKSIHAKIVEVFATGQVHQVEAIQNDPDSETIQVLQGVAGIGPAKAKELVQQNIRTIQDLRNNPAVLNDKQQIGLKYYDDFLARIPRKEMDKHAAAVATVIEKIKPGLAHNITGSYRRGAKNSGDIDVLLSCTDEDCTQLLTGIVEQLQKEGYLYETLAKGDKKYMGVCKLKRHKTFRRFDLMYATPDRYAFTLLYFTGDGEFNIQMRNHALSLGYSLSEYGLKYTKGARKGELVNDTFNSEEDIFSFLGLKYVEPQNRKAGALSVL